MLRRICKEVYNPRWIQWLRSIFVNRGMNTLFILRLLIFLFCSSRTSYRNRGIETSNFILIFRIEMTTKNRFDVLNVSFYGTYVVITFQSSNWTICQNAYKFKWSVWTHVKGAKQRLDTNPINQFYSAMNKVERAGKCERIDRRDWTVRHDVFYYSKGVWGNKKDCYFYKPQGLFA